MHLSNSSTSFTKSESASGSLAKNVYISSSDPSYFLRYLEANLHSCGHSLLSLNPICLAAIKGETELKQRLNIFRRCYCLRTFDLFAFKVSHCEGVGMNEIALEKTARTIKHLHRSKCILKGSNHIITYIMGKPF